MTRRRPLRRFAALTLLACAAALPASAATSRLDSNPLAPGGSTPFFVEGDAARFTWVGNTPPRFAGDRRGSLRVLYDTTRPTGRIGATIGDVFSLDEDFRFGAVLTIRSAGFAADPNGFSQIAFGLWNSHTTGMGRTAFPSDAFDLVEFDWFANVGEFGGPFLSPSIFGGSVGANAFDNFAFQSSEVALPFDVPLLCEGVYDAASRTLKVTVSRHVRGPRFDPIPGAETTVDLSRVDPAFLVDTFGIGAYGEGWPSLHAEVDFDLLYAGTAPPPLSVAGGTNASATRVRIPVSVVPAP